MPAGARACAGADHEPLTRGLRGGGPERECPCRGRQGAHRVFFVVALRQYRKTGETALQQATGADILRLEATVAYPSDYSECAEAALAEHDENARPEIANLPETLDAYETIFVGYPIWWHTAPMLIGTFLEHYDWSGRDVYPFAQSASMDAEQFANSMDFVRECAKGATVHDGLFASADDAEDILAYLTENGFINEKEGTR